MSREAQAAKPLTPVQSRLIGALYRSARLRRQMAPLIPAAVARRTYPLALLRGYEDFNRGESIPHANFAADFELYQAAEVLGTVGTFHGPTALDEVIAELRDAFDDVRFVPEEIKRIDDVSLVFFVRFRAVGRGSGVRVDRTIAHVWTREELQARRLEVYWEPAEALEAVGQRE